MKLFIRSLLLLMAVLSFTDCKKDIANTPVYDYDQAPDLVSKIRSSVSGIVTDENDNPVAGAMVKAGTATAQTDNFGYFVIKNVELSKTAAVVTVTHSGYFKAAKTWTAMANHMAFFRMKLIPKTNVGTIASAAGGNVTANGGFTISFPADAFENAATGTAYSGNVVVSAHWIDPTSSELYNIMPGDLRALNNEGLLRILKTFGMAAVELNAPSGEALQLSEGKSAQLQFPIPAALSGTAPANIPLWYFEESTGLWIEEGNATRNGDKYEGSVNHFSFWNCDVPNIYSSFSCRFVTDDNQPFAHTLVKISKVSDPLFYSYGVTNDSGFVDGYVPANENLKIELMTYTSCSVAVYTQTFISNNGATNLGNINASSVNDFVASISGSATDCNNSPLSNGYVLVQINNDQHVGQLNADGTFHFNITVCTASAPAQFLVVNSDIMQQSQPQTVTVNSSTHNEVGQFVACGLSALDFFTVTIGNVTYSLNAPPDLIQHSMFPVNTEHWIYFEDDTTALVGQLAYESTGIGLNSVQQINSFALNGAPGSTVGNYYLNPVQGPVTIQFTEFGTVGNFIAGNFSGILTSGPSSPPANTNYQVSGSFRTRRNF